MGYINRYNAEIVATTLTYTADNIIEPGEDVEIRNLTMKNSGKMPTPTQQPLVFTIKDDKWITFRQH